MAFHFLFISQGDYAASICNVCRPAWFACADQEGGCPAESSVTALSFPRHRRTSSLEFSLTCIKSPSTWAGKFRKRPRPPRPLQVLSLTLFLPVAAISHCEHVKAADDEALAKPFRTSCFAAAPRSRAFQPFLPLAIHQRKRQNNPDVTAEQVSHNKNSLPDCILDCGQAVGSGGGQSLRMVEVQDP